MQGKRVNEFKHSEERVTTKADFKVEGKGCLDHPPIIKDDGELDYITSITRLQVPRSPVSVLNHSQNFPPTIRT